MSLDITQLNRRRLLAAGSSTLATAGLMSAMSTASAQAQTVAPRRTTPRPPGTKKFALVLGSGAARGFAHIGVIKAFEEAGVRPDLIVGTSAGALVGAFAAAGISPAQMEETALRVRDIEIVDFETGSKRGMVVGDSLQRFVNLAVRSRSIESLQTPFAAIATQLRTGEMAMLQRGDLGLAVRASCSVPGVFIPAKIGEVEYVDGALVSPVPVRAARQLGAELVVAVDVGSATMNANPLGTYEQVMHAFEIMGRSLAGLESEQADVMIRPDTRSIPSTDFSSRGALISIGYSVGKRFAPVVAEKIAQMKARRS